MPPEKTPLTGHRADTPRDRATSHGRAVDGWGLVVGFVIGVAVVCPTFFIEESWRGRPLIDQGGQWWLLPALVMGGGFFAGGLMAGRHCPRITQAFTRGLLVAVATLGVIFVGDLIRRHVNGQVLTTGVEDLWLIAAAAAVVVGGLGGFVGYRRTVGTNPTGR